VDVIHTDSRQSKTHQSIERLVCSLVSVRQGIFVDITIHICIQFEEKMVDSTLKMCAVGSARVCLFGIHIHSGKCTYHMCTNEERLRMSQEIYLRSTLVKWWIVHWKSCTMKESEHLKCVLLDISRVVLR
jgi:hypothetical protein